MFIIRSSLLLGCMQVALGERQCSASLQQGMTYTYHGKRVFDNNSGSGKLDLSILAHSSSSLTLSSDLSVASIRPFRETFSFQTDYRIDPATCMLILSNPGLAGKISVHREGVGEKKYPADSYVVYLTRLFSGTPRVVSQYWFGFVHSSSNMIVMNRDMQLQGKQQGRSPMKTAVPVAIPKARRIGVNGGACPAMLPAGSEYRFQLARGEGSVLFTVSTQRSTLRLTTEHKFFDEGYKHTHAMTTGDVPYSINPESCMIIFSGDKFDTVNVVKEFRGKRLIFPTETEEYIGRKYLNVLLWLLGENGLNSGRALGEARGRDVIRLDKNVDLKRQ